MEKSILDYLKKPYKRDILFATLVVIVMTTASILLLSTTFMILYIILEILIYIKFLLGINKDSKTNKKK